MEATDDKIIGKGTWIDKIADSIIKRETRLSRPKNLLRVESGLGASGIPHIGSMGDAVRAYGISLAIKNFGFDSELIAFSDDFDGLRKVPSGLPSGLEKYICKPVSLIPDPFGDCHESYGQHMSSLLLEGLDAAGIRYKFKSATELYKSGILSEQINKILSNSKQIGDKISESTGQQKYTKYLPFFPLCENCNRLYVANAIEYFPLEKRVSYNCIGNTINKKYIDGCGYNGEIKIDNGSIGNKKINKGIGKLAWKVEFAARWQALDIKFEAFGKDIMDSVRINDWISDQILGFPHPFHVKYEMFLDKGGKKISKSAGNVLTPQMWLKYGSTQSLLLLLYKRIAGTRHVSLEDIPNLMDEYDYYEDLYFGKIKEQNRNRLIKFNGIYEYINHLNPPLFPQTHIPYRMLIQQADLFVDHDEISVKKILDRLKKYGLIKDEIIDNKIKDRINLALQWSRDFNIFIESKNEEHFHENYKSNRLEISALQKKILLNIIDEFDKLETDSSASRLSNDDMSQRIQTIVYENAKLNGINPKELFKLFYNILINTEKGPRLGNYINDLGLKNVIRIISDKVGIGKEIN